MTLRERVEDNVAVWLLGSLLTGFLSGIATYKAILEMGGLESISKQDYGELQRKASNLQEQNTRYEGEITELQQKLTKTAGAQQPINNPNRIKGVAVSGRPTGENASEPQASFPQLRNARVTIVFPDRTGGDLANKVKAELADYDASGYFLPNPLNLPPGQVPSNANDFVYYGRTACLPAALDLSHLLSQYGFHGAKFDSNNGLVANNDGGCALMINLWPK